jgi:hypothetical protein
MVGRPCGQFQGDSSVERCPRMACICPRVSALPIITDDRHALIASIARTLHHHGADSVHEKKTCSPLCVG